MDRPIEKPITDFRRAAIYMAQKQGKNRNLRTKEVWFFHDADKKQIRLIAISSDAFPQINEVPAFRFPPFEGSIIPFGVAVAVIRPEDKLRLALPPGWGAWEQAEKLWPLPKSKAGKGKKK